MALRDRVATRTGPTGVDLDEHYRARLLEEIDPAALNALTPSQRRARLERLLSELLSHDGPVLGQRERAGLIQRVVDDALGLGVLEPLLADPSVTEIMVNGPDDVFIERAGRIQRAPSRFRSEAHLYQTIDRIVSSVNRRVDESSPMVDARLETGERVNVIIPPLALDGPTLTIRRFPEPFRLSELVRRGSLDESAAALLSACVRAHLSILVSGGTGTGKTTFLNALSGTIPEDERIVTIEDAAELSLQQEHVVRLESRPPNVEGRGEVTIRHLVRNALRMRPDRIVVGEVRGGEAMDMLQAMNTGHEGSLATVHANGARDALGRLETLATMSELDLPSGTIRQQINSAIDLVVHLVRAADGSRRVGELSAVVSEGTQEYRLHPIGTFQQEALTPTGRVEGAFVRHLLPATLARRLALAGEPAAAWGVAP